jgi:hypothetical protein
VLYEQNRDFTGHTGQLKGESIAIESTCDPRKSKFIDIRQIDKTYIVDQESLDILEWLPHLNFRSTQNNNLGRRKEGTGEWLLNHPDFTEWLYGRHKVLWCPGDRLSIFSPILTLR